MAGRNMARNWLKAPLGFNGTGTDLQSTWTLTSPCRARQLLPTRDIACLLNTRVTEYSKQFSSLSPIIPNRKYDLAEKTKQNSRTDTSTSYCGCGARKDKTVEKSSSPCFYTSSGGGNGESTVGLPREFHHVKELLKHHSCNYDYDKKICSSFKSPSHNRNWVKIRKAVQAMKLCGFVSQKRRSGLCPNAKQTGSRRINQNSGRTNRLQETKTESIDECFVNASFGNGGKCLQSGGGECYAEISSNDVELGCEKLRPLREKITSPLDDFYGGRYTANAKYVGNKRDRVCDRSNVEVTTGKSKAITNEKIDTSGGTMSNAFCCSPCENGKGRFNSQEKRRCGNNIYVYNENDGRIYNSKDYASDDWLSDYRYSNISGNGQNAASDAATVTKRARMQNSEFMGQSATSKGKYSRSGPETGSSGRNGNFNRPRGGTEGYSNISKAYIPEDGRRKGKLKPLEFVPRPNLDIPEVFVTNFYEGKNRSEDGKNMDKAGGKRNKNKKLKNQSSTKQQKGGGYVGMNDWNANYVEVKVKRVKGKKKGAVRFEEPMSEYPPPPETLEFFKD